MVKKIALLALILFTPSLAFGQVLTRIISSDLTVEAAAYATGDVVGELITYTNACSSRSQFGEIRGVTVFDKAAQGVDLDLVLFSSNPTGSSFTDNAAFDPVDADLAKITAVIPITTHKAFSDNGVSQAKSISYPFSCAVGSFPNSGTLYGVLVSRGAPTYAATSDVTVQVEFLND